MLAENRHRSREFVKFGFSRGSSLSGVVHVAQGTGVFETWFTAQSEIETVLWFERSAHRVPTQIWRTVGGQPEQFQPGKGTA